MEALERGQGLMRAGSFKEKEGVTLRSVIMTRLRSSSFVQVAAAALRPMPIFSLAMPTSKIDAELMTRVSGVLNPRQSCGLNKCDSRKSVRMSTIAHKKRVHFKLDKELAEYESDASGRIKVGDAYVSTLSDTVSRIPLEDRGTSDSDDIWMSYPALSQLSLQMEGVRPAAEYSNQLWMEVDEQPLTENVLSSGPQAIEESREYVDHCQHGQELSLDSYESRDIEWPASSYSNHLWIAGDQQYPSEIVPTRGPHEQAIQGDQVYLDRCQHMIELSIDALENGDIEGAQELRRIAYQLYGLHTQNSFSVGSGIGGRAPTHLIIDSTGSY